MAVQVQYLRSSSQERLGVKNAFQESGECGCNLAYFRRSLHTVGTHAVLTSGFTLVWKWVLLMGEVSDIFSRVSENVRPILIRHRPFLRLQNGRRNLAANGTATTQR